MSSIPKRKIAYYKKAKFLRSPGQTLQQIIIAATEKHKLPLDRQQILSGEVKTLNYNLHHDGSNGNSVLGVEIVGYAPGADQPVVETKAGAEVLPFEALTLDAGKEFVGGAAYLAVWENHVAIIQSSGVRTVEVEAYLNWLFKFHTTLLDKDNRVELCDETPEKARSGGLSVRAIEFSQPVALQAVDGDVEVDTKAVRGSSKKKQEKFENLEFKPGGPAWSAVETFLGDLLGLPTQMRADELVRKGNLEVSMKLRWKTRSKEATSQFLQDVTQQMRHLTDEIDYKIETTAGDISRDEIKLRRPVSCMWKNGRPDPSELFPLLADWLDNLIDEGKVAT